MAGQQHDEVDVAYLKFGQDFEGVDFIANAIVGILLESLKEGRPDKVNSPAFESALQYAKRFKGAIEIQDHVAVDELTASLNALEFIRAKDDGTEERLSLHKYEITALTNLNPGSVAAAKSLIPSLGKYADDEVEDVLKLLRRASARYTGS